MLMRAGKGMICFSSIITRNCFGDYSLLNSCFHSFMGGRPALPPWVIQTWRQPAGPAFQVPHSCRAGQRRVLTLSDAREAGTVLWLLLLMLMDTACCTPCWRWCTELCVQHSLTVPLHLAQAYGRSPHSSPLHEAEGTAPRPLQASCCCLGWSTASSLAFQLCMEQSPAWQANQPLSFFPLSLRKRRWKGLGLLDLGHPALLPMGTMGRLVGEPENAPCTNVSTAQACPRDLSFVFWKYQRQLMSLASVPVLLPVTSQL